ncbi:DNA repair protein XRCC4 isoform X2 [Mugil cephalus]|uniref:DNA repair protein XRCC4 isoform X2 n=1 Tax=Mugil cephalus TaxID=48193 RepID=UPI001FB5D69B|nr:DNA repair protein XRCC4 isoform X2 [Mugil cephalus]
MHTEVRRLHVSSQPDDSAYFLRVDWRGWSLATGFQLLLTDGREAWRGGVTQEEVRQEAEELEMETDRYVQDLLQALTTEDTSSYSFTLTPPPPVHSSTLTLDYDKKQQDISFRLGSVQLKAVAEPVEAVREFLTHSLQRGTVLHQHNQELEEENQRLRGEHQRIAAEMQRYVGGKEALEEELFSRFVLVLNEKKMKIRSLQETVTSLQETRSSDKEQKKTTKKKEKKKNEEEEEGSVKSADDEEAEDDDYGGSTDEEAPEEEEEKMKRPPASEPSSRDPSTPSPLDDSLSDITDVAPCRKRRFRQLRSAPEAPAAAARAESRQQSSDQKKKKRTDPPAGARPTPPPPQRSADAAAVEDLFDDF